MKAILQHDGRKYPCDIADGSGEYIEVTEPPNIRAMLTGEPLSLFPRKARFRFKELTGDAAIYELI